MPEIIYRKEDRDPPTIMSHCAATRVKGFNAWVPLTPDQARSFLYVTCGVDWSKHLGILPSTVKSLVLRNYKQDTVNPADLSRYIISQTTHDTPHISTGVTEQCGGVVRTYIYKLQFNFDFVKVRLTPPLLGVDKFKFRPNLLHPDLWMNHSQLSQASMLGLRQKGGTDEVTFLTSIPRDYIVGWRRLGVEPKLYVTPQWGDAKPQTPDPNRTLRIRNDLQQLRSGATTLNKLVEAKFDALKKGPIRALDQVLWQRAFKDVCLEFGQIDKSWLLKANGPPIPRRVAPQPPRK